MFQPGAQLVAKHSFAAEGEGELSIAAGAQLSVMQPESASNLGWLLMRDEASGAVGYVPSDFVGPPAPSRSSMTVPPALAARYQEQTSRDELAESAWGRRDQVFGGGGSTPLPSQRRWFYRDLFAELQGPFNEQEMQHRVEAKHISPDSFCAVEVNSAPTQYEERRLRELFPSSAVAFKVPAALAPSTTAAGSDRFWYFMQAQQQPLGPFSTEQMRFWFDVEGYFGSNSLVSDAASGARDFAPLKHVFPDPMLCFLGSTASQPPQQPPTPPPALASSPASQRKSSRALLQSALAGNGPDKPKDDEDDELDDTLALFDKIELEHATASSPEQAAANAAVGVSRVYGDAAYEWPVWRGVPQPSKGSTSFPTALYSFVTRPLNPGAGRILSHVVREVEGVMSLTYDKFRLFLENENGTKLTLVASRHLSLSGATTFDIKLVANERSPALLIAKLDVNFMGTQFTLHNDVPGHVGAPKDLCCILYEANRMGAGGPRKMKVAIPDLDGAGEFNVFKRTGGSNQLVASLNAINSSRRCVAMLNKPPKWNAQRGSYALDFGNRVQRASVKNFQLVDALNDPEHTRVILQHGRVSDDKFTADVMHPMSLLQAFAVCLSSLHQKKAVD